MSNNYNIRPAIDIFTEMANRTGGAQELPIPPEAFRDAFASLGAPVVADAAARDALFPTPQGDEKVLQKDIGAMQRYDATAGRYVADLMPMGSAVLSTLYTGATNEAKITAAISNAAARGVRYAWVPASMLPYNPSLVTFNNSVRMVCEGGMSGVYDVRAYGAGGLGSANDNDILAINQAIIAANANGGGKVFVPGGHYKGVSNLISVLPLSNVELCGAGAASWIDTHWNALMLFTDANVTSYKQFAWKLATAVAVGDRTISLQTIGDAAVFTAGALVMLRSVTTDASDATTEFPSFVELVKIESVNTGTGVITLENPITDAITDPEIGVSPLYQSAAPFVENFTCHHLRLTADYTNNSTALTVQGIYKSYFHHLWLEGKNGILTNAATRCFFHDIQEKLYHTTGMLNRVLEIKSGSLSSRYHDIRAEVLNLDASTDQITPLSIGERSRDQTVNGLEVYAPQMNVSACVGATSATRSKVSNVKIWAKNTVQGVFFQNVTTNYKWKLDSQARDITVYLTGQFESGVNINGDLASTHLDVDGVRIVGTNGAWNGGSINGVAFGGSATDVHVRNSVLPGKYTATASNTDCHLHGCVTDGPFNQASRVVVLHDHRSSGAVALPGPQNLYNSTVTSTTPNNVVLTYTIPQSWFPVVGDKVRVRLSGAISGANNTKTIAIADANGAQISLVAAAADTGSFVIDIVATVVTASGTGSQTMGLRYGGYSIFKTVGLPVAYQPLSSGLNLNTGSVAITVQAWVLNASDNIYFNTADIQFIRQQDGVQDGVLG